MPRFPFALLARHQARGIAAWCATRLWTNPCISTGANVQKRDFQTAREICAPSVQAGYSACSAHRNVAKPLSLWRKSVLSTENCAVNYYYYFVYIPFN
jgi:hypothetical protein